MPLKTSSNLKLKNSIKKFDKTKQLIYEKKFDCASLSPPEDLLSPTENGLQKSIKPLLKNASQRLFSLVNEKNFFKSEKEQSTTIPLQNPTTRILNTHICRTTQLFARNLLQQSLNIKDDDEIFITPENGLKNKKCDNLKTKELERSWVSFGENIHDSLPFIDSLSQTDSLNSLEKKKSIEVLTTTTAIEIPLTVLENTSSNVSIKNLSNSVDIEV